MDEKILGNNFPTQQVSGLDKAEYFKELGMEYSGVLLQ